MFHQLLPYLGSKRHLLDLIGDALKATGCQPRRTTFVDAFAGSGVVARFAKTRGFAVIANDWEPYSRVVLTAALLPDKQPPFAQLGGYVAALATLNALDGIDGWVSDTLCPVDDQAPDPSRERLFYRRATGRRIDAIRQRIADWQHDGLIEDVETCCLLTPLLYQACWLANTSGVFKGFHAGWGGSNGTALHRILADLQLQPLVFAASRRRRHVMQCEVLQLPQALRQQRLTADVVYLDPPYNQHPYASNYHVLNSLVLWDRPTMPAPTERGHKAAIRRDWRERRSAFNSRRDAEPAFAAMLDAFDARHLLISYSSDGMLPVETLRELAATHGHVHTFERSYKRYRTSPTRPSPRPHNTEFILHIDRGARGLTVAAS